jgi:hypothetical protein
MFHTSRSYVLPSGKYFDNLIFSLMMHRCGALGVSDLKMYEEMQHNILMIMDQRIIIPCMRLSHLLVVK